MGRLGTEGVGSGVARVWAHVGTAAAWGVGRMEGLAGHN